jgi:hypothetical protein
MSSVLQESNILKRHRSRSPQRTSPRQSPTRSRGCFSCGVEGHYSAQCDKQRNRSPQRFIPRLRSPSPKKQPGSSLSFNVPRHRPENIRMLMAYLVCQMN